MELATTLYLSVGIFFVLAFIGTLFAIAGKSIMFELLRRMFPKGADVFIVNSNRQISQYYREPKDNQFHINKKMYIINPDKVLAKSDDMNDESHKIVKEFIGNKRKRIQKRMDDFEEKKQQAIKERDKLNPDNASIKAEIDGYSAFILDMDDKIQLLSKKLVDREQTYYHRRRPAFFYIEGDPIPKDFHEFYTHMDSITIDNVIARSMTKDPKAVKDMEKQLKDMKLLLLATLIAAIIGAVIAFTLKADIQTIAAATGAVITI